MHPVVEKQSHERFCDSIEAAGVDTFVLRFLSGFLPLVMKVAGFIPGAFPAPIPLQTAGQQAGKVT